jgi:hypothetical protein
MSTNDLILTVYGFCFSIMIIAATIVAMHMLAKLLRDR